MMHKACNSLLKREFCSTSLYKDLIRLISNPQSPYPSNVLYPSNIIYQCTLDIEPLIHNLTYKPLYSLLWFSVSYPIFVYNPFLAVIPLSFSFGQLWIYYQGMQYSKSIIKDIVLAGNSVKFILFEGKPLESDITKIKSEWFGQETKGLLTFTINNQNVRCWIEEGKCEVPCIGLFAAVSRADLYKVNSFRLGKEQESKDQEMEDLEKELFKK